MTVRVMTFLDGVGRQIHVLLHRVAPNAYGGGGSPPLPYYTQFDGGVNNLFETKELTGQRERPDMDDYNVNLMRLIAGELYFLLGMHAAREMYGKSYFSLGGGEKIAVDQAVLGAVQGNCQAMTPEFVRGVVVPQAPASAPQKPAVGFQPPNPTPKSGA